MKVLFVTEHFYPHIGGGEKLLLDLALALINKGIEVKIVTSNSGGITGTHEYQDLEIHSYEWRTLFGHPIPKVNDVLGFTDWADIIQTAQYTAAPSALKAAKKMKIPCVIMSYEYLGKKWRLVDNPLNSRLFEVFEWWVFHKPYNAFIAISKASKKDLISSGINSKKVSVIYPVFNDFKFWKKKGENDKNRNTEKNFLYYGRPGKTKGIFVLIDAIKLLDQSLSQDVHFNLILSNDPIKERNRVVDFINRNDLNDRVTILDPQPEAKLKKSIQESYAVIVPSLTEGFGYSAYQACMLGKNIIVSNAGSLPEVISGNCLVFNNGDAQSLSKAITKAVNNQYIHYKDRIGGDNTDKVVELYTKLIQ